MDAYADDLATLMDTLDLKNAVLFGFSAGGGEVARYIGRHGPKRVAAWFGEHTSQTPKYCDAQHFSVATGL